jgi:hypothetical protein
MGAQQIAVPSDGTRTGGGVSPWAIVTSGRVKRYDGSTFATLPNDPGFCATSLAVGPLGGQRKYAWALGCTPVSGGNYELHRYRHVDGSGGWVRSPAFAGVQVTVDGTGAPWIRTAAGLTFRVTLDANDVPIGVNSFNPPGGTALQIAAGGHGNLFLPPVVLTPNGHLHIWNFDNTESW